VASSALSDALGAFAIERIPSGRYVRIGVEKEGYLADVVEARVPMETLAFEVGTVRMVRGDWKRKLEGGPRGLVGLNHELRDGKVFITAVRPKTPAERAGLKRGDGIVSVDGKSMDNLPHAARTYHLQGKAGTTVSLVVQGRDGARRTVVLERQQVAGVADVPTFY
jgi:S1-C subfamily serine protease